MTTSMTPSTEFRRHAAECNRMARAAADRDSKMTWKSLAERWLTAAKLAERDEELMKSSLLGPKAPRRRSRSFEHRGFAH